MLVEVDTSLFSTARLHASDCCNWSCCESLSSSGSVVLFLLMQHSPWFEETLSTELTFPTILLGVSDVGLVGNFINAAILLSRSCVLSRSEK